MDKDLLELENKLSLYTLEDELKLLCINQNQEFNIFDIMHINQEVQFSYILSFLLDQYESHGLKDSFLITFLDKINEKRNEFGFDDLKSSKEVEIKLEETALNKNKTEGHKKRRRTDISINNSDKWKIIIENKIHSSAISKEQLEESEKQFRNPKRDFCFVFITPSSNLKDNIKMATEKCGIIHFTWSELVDLLFNFKYNHSLDSKMDYILSDLIYHIQNNIIGG
jgi:hypothetical protein